MKDKVVHLKLVPKAICARAFLVRWQNEDAGWQQITVAANTAEDARSLVADLIGRDDLQVLAA